ncbi:MAG: hypothetical protein Q4D87_01380 [Actinomycetaceae bacterium]|nr:hypothetical protein [Actinomycetaceae bacterium]
MSDTYRSDLDGPALVEFIERASKTLDALAPFLDDLNALRGSDFDTGSNAARSMAAIMAMVERSGGAPASAAATAEALTVYSRSSAQGHVGLLITNVLAALSNVAKHDTIRPIDLRAFLASLPKTIEGAFSQPASELKDMAHAAAEVAAETPDPINAVHIMIGNASMVSQDALIEATSGWINPGACVLSVMISALHSVYERSGNPLSVVQEMMKSLAETAAGARGDSNEPHKGAQFSVDFHVDFMEEDFEQFRAVLDDRDLRYSLQGSAGVLGMGTWRFHIDTATPSSVIPRTGWVRHIVVKDARYGELIGYDELEVQQEASGVLYLSRPTWQRPETVRVIALLRHEHFLEEVASTGAHVVLNPIEQDAVVISELMLSAPAGVSLVLAGDDAAQQIARRAEKLAKRSRDVVVVKDSEPLSDVAVSVLAAQSAPIFMPQVGERTASVTTSLLESSASRAKSRVVIIEELDPETVNNQLVQLIGYGLDRVIMMTPRPDALLRHAIEMALEERGATAFVEYVRAEPSQVVLVNG